MIGRGATQCKFDYYVSQELEKFKFVLDYKIKELKAQIDPKNDDIAAMKRDIQGMDTDLEDYHRKNKLLQQNV